jgi:type IV fimbrial biogenesis protein FimT
MTLIEISVTLVLLGLMLVASMPSISAWMRNTQVRNTAASMVAGLTQARNEAIRRNTPIRFSMVSLADAAVMNSSCALSGTGVSWVVSVRDPAGQCGYAPSNDPSADAANANNPLIVESNAGGVGGRNVVVAAKEEDASAANGVVTFNGFGRVVDTSPVRVIDINNDTSGNDFRRLRIEIGTGGAVRLCDLAVTDNTDSRNCATRTSIP